MTTTPAPSSAAPRPMDGILVLDFTQVIAGPMATMMCADLGATVIKVEPPTGDNGRAYGSSDPSVIATPVYDAFNRGKRSIALDLRHEDDLALAKKIARQADVVVSAFRPGVMERLGLGYDELRADNPRLIYGLISGFGPDGPGRTRPGFDGALQAETGLLELCGEPDGPPQRIGTHVVDVTTGHVMFQAILAALLNRERHGVGECIQTCLYDCGISLHTHHFSEYLTHGVAPGRYGNQAAMSAPSGLYQTKDGYIVFSANSVKHWSTFLKVTGSKELASEDYATQNLRTANRDTLVPIVKDIMLRHTTDEWIEIFEENSMVYGRLQDYAAITSSEQFAVNDLALESRDRDRTVRSVRPPVRYSSFDYAQTNASPGIIGQDSDEIRAEFA